MESRISGDTDDPRVRTLDGRLARAVDTVGSILHCAANRRSTPAHRGSAVR